MKETPKQARFLLNTEAEHGRGALRAQERVTAPYVFAERAVETNETLRVKDAFSRPEGAAQVAFLSPDALGIPRTKDLHMRAATIFEKVVILFTTFVIGALVPVIFVVAEQEYGLLGALLLLVLLLFAFLDVILKRTR